MRVRVWSQLTPSEFAYDVIALIEYRSDGDWMIATFAIVFGIFLFVVVRTAYILTVAFFCIAFVGTDRNRSSSTVGVFDVIAHSSESSQVRRSMTSCRWTYAFGGGTLEMAKDESDCGSAGLTLAVGVILRRNRIRMSMSIVILSGRALLVYGLLFIPNESS